MKKRTLYTEISYIIGLVLLALGTSLTVRADFGVSMVVAPAFLVYLKINTIFSFFTFGMAEIIFQTLLMVLMIVILREFHLRYLFAFVTILIYSLCLDGFTLLINLIPNQALYVRIILYAVGLLLCALAVSFIFHSYITPEVYELFVKEFSRKYNKKITKVKIIFDCTCCAIGIALSFIFFGLWQFKGVNIGTVISAVLSGPLIGMFTRILEKNINFVDFKKAKPIEPNDQ